MANPGDINANGYMLPAALRSVLGLDAPQTAPQANAVSGVGAPSPQVPQSIMDMLNPPPRPAPTEPVQNRPDYVVPAPDVPNTPAGVAKANKAYDQRQAQAAQQAYALGQRMPTIADLTNQQTRAAQEEMDANNVATTAAARTAQDTYAVNKQAETDLKASNDALKTMQAESAKIRANKEQAAQAISQEVDNYKVDQNRYWHDAGTGKKVGWLVAMALSGIGDAFQHKSGPNAVVGMLDATIDKDVRAQMDAREQLKEKLGRANAEVDKWDRFSANKEAQFLANRAQAKELVAQQLLTASSKYGSDIAMANGAKTAADIRKSAAKDQLAAVDMAHNHDVQDKQLAISKQQVGIAAGHLKLARDQFDWQKDKDQQQLDLEAAKIAAKGDPKATEAYQKFGISGVSDKDAAGNDVPFVAQGTPEGVEKVREKMAASKTMVNLLDRALRIRTGGSFDAAKSDEWRKLQQIWSTAKAKGKDALGLGALSGDDYKLLEGYLGTADPTEWRDPSAGIKAARQSILDDANDTLHAHGLSDKARWDLPDIGANGPPTELPGDEAAKRVLADTAESGNAGRDLGVPMVDPANPDRYEMRVANAYRDAGGVLNYQRQTLDTWAAGLRSADPKLRQMASENLAAAANSAQSKGVRAYAQQLLSNSVAGGIANPDESTDPNAGRAVARDSISQPLYPSPGTRR